MTALKKCIAWVLEFPCSETARKVLRNALNGTSAVKQCYTYYRVDLPIGQGQNQEKKWYTFSWGNPTSRILKGHKEYPPVFYNTQDEAYAAAVAKTRELRRSGAKTLSNLRDRFLQARVPGEKGYIAVDEGLPRIKLQWTQNGGLSLRAEGFKDKETHGRCFNFPSFPDGNMEELVGQEKMAEVSAVDMDEYVEMTAEEFASLSKAQQAHYYVYRPSGFDYPEQPVPVSPYFLGLWLGDGSRRSTTIHNNHEQEICEFLASYAAELDLHFIHHGSLKYAIVGRTSVGARPMPTATAPHLAQKQRDEMIKRFTILGKRLDSGWKIVHGEDGASATWKAPREVIDRRVQSLLHDDQPEHAAYTMVKRPGNASVDSPRVRKHRNEIPDPQGTPSSARLTDYSAALAAMGGSHHATPVVGSQTVDNIGNATPLVGSQTVDNVYQATTSPVGSQTVDDIYQATPLVGDHSEDDLEVIPDVQPRSQSLPHRPSVDPPAAVESYSQDNIDSDLPLIPQLTRRCPRISSSQRSTASRASSPPTPEIIDLTISSQPEQPVVDDPQHQVIDLISSQPQALDADEDDQAETQSQASTASFPELGRGEEPPKPESQSSGAGVVLFPGFEAQALRSSQQSWRAGHQPLSRNLSSKSAESEAIPEDPLAELLSDREFMSQMNSQIGGPDIPIETEEDGQVDMIADMIGMDVGGARTIDDSDFEPDSEFDDELPADHAPQESRQYRLHTGARAYGDLDAEEEDILAGQIMPAQEKKSTVNTLLQAMNRLGVIYKGTKGPAGDTKHIPECYMKNSREVRLAVLAGLLDTDGCYCVTRNGSAFFKFTQSSVWHQRLFWDFVALARSLGFLVSTREAMSWPSKLVKTSTPQLIARVFRNIHEIPTLLHRKRALESLRGQSRNHRVTSVTLDEEETEWFGFRVDKDNLYLRHDHIVLHNSGFEESMVSTPCILPFFFQKTC